MQATHALQATLLVINVPCLCAAFGRPGGADSAFGSVPFAAPEATPVLAVAQADDNGGWGGPPPEPAAAVEMDSGW